MFQVLREKLKFWEGGGGTILAVGEANVQSNLSEVGYHPTWLGISGHSA